METIFFHKYPKKEKDINKVSTTITLIGSIALICIALFLLHQGGLINFCLALVCSIGAYDFLVQSIAQISYNKNMDIYNKNGDRWLR